MACSLVDIAFDGTLDNWSEFDTRSDVVDVRLEVLRDVVSILSALYHRNVTWYLLVGTNPNLGGQLVLMLMEFGQ